MRYPIIKPRFFDKIIVELHSMVSEFSSDYDDEDGVYTILGHFSRFVTDNLDNAPISKKTFAFIDSALENGDPETITAIQIEIFEQLFEGDEYIEKGKAFHEQANVRSI